MTPRQDQPNRSELTPRPGQMTAVMRAASALAESSVLRIGLVRAGRVVEERLLKQRQHVTIGPTEQSMFVLPGDLTPPNFRLFELVGTEYRLNFLEGMTGRVALETGVVDLDALRIRTRRGHSSCQARLTAESCGRIVIGDTTFLFKFVVPPPVQPKAQLPLSLRKGFSDQIDWAVTLIAGFSFLLHFGLVGALYSDWMDPIVSDEVAVAGFIDAIKSLPQVAAVETAKDPTQSDTPADAKEPVRTPGEPSSPGKRGTPSAPGRAALSTEDLERLGMDIISRLNRGAPPTSDSLGRGQAPLGALDDAARRESGVTNGPSSDLHLADGVGGPLAVGKGPHGLDSLGRTTGTIDGVGRSREVSGPRTTTELGRPEIKGIVFDADRTVMTLRPGFRACYNQGLAKNPTLQGSVRIVANVGPNGEVLSANASGGSALDGDVVACVIQRVKSAQFASPQGGRATVVIPVTFALQQ